VDGADAKELVNDLRGRGEQKVQITQIYEGTNQIHRVVIDRSLLK
jgi:alkylation response protein AidB-like acyl-CoA dehydrogenase